MTVPQGMISQAISADHVKWREQSRRSTNADWALSAVGDRGPRDFLQSHFHTGVGVVKGFDKYLSITKAWPCTPGPTVGGGAASKNLKGGQTKLGVGGERPKNRYPRTPSPSTSGERISTRLPIQC